MQLPKRKPDKYSQTPTDHVMSKQKFEELGHDLERLKKKRPQAAAEVSRLAELGDFSENVEYQLAKGRLRGINSAILKMEYQMNHADIIQKSGRDGVEIGSVVTIRSDKGEKTYTILGSAETNPLAGVISHLSPVGSALLGRYVGDTVTVEKNKTIEIIKIK